MMNCLGPDLRRQSDPLAPNEVDWLLLETSYWPNDLEHSADGPHYCATLLLSCSQAASVGQTLARSANDAHQMTCTYGKTHLSTSCNWIHRAGASNRTIEHAVLYADDSAGLSGSDVDGLVRSLKADGVESVIVVCGDAKTRVGIPSADAFVIGSVQTDITTAAMLTDIVHNGLYAPARITCPDREDLQNTLGTAQTPSVLAEALWQPEPFRFEFMADTDRVAFETAGAVFVHPALGLYRFGQLSQMRHELLALRRRDPVDDVFSWPMHGFQFAWNSPRAALVRLLCRP